DGIRGFHVTGVQTCALPISRPAPTRSPPCRCWPRGAPPRGRPMSDSPRPGLAGRLAAAFQANPLTPILALLGLLLGLVAVLVTRSEERRVGKEAGSVVRGCA